MQIQRRDNTLLHFKNKGLHREGESLSNYIANKGFVALFALLAVMHMAWASYEWWWLFSIDRASLPDGMLQFKARWTAPLLTTLAMSAATLSYMVLRNPLGAMRMSLWFAYLAMLAHLVLLNFDPGRQPGSLAHWLPAVALGILAYKITKRYNLSKAD